MINYNDRFFQVVTSSANGEVSNKTIFHYRHEGNILTSEYSGEKIRKGFLIGLVAESGKIDMRYQHINDKNEIMTGTCFSTPEVLPNGKIRLHENWQWTSGDRSEGTSVIEEV